MHCDPAENPGIRVAQVTAGTRCYTARLPDGDAPYFILSIRAARPAARWRCTRPERGLSGIQIARHCVGYLPLAAEPILIVLAGPYSARSVETGSVKLARAAGTNIAATATSISTRVEKT